MSTTRKLVSRLRILAVVVSVALVGGLLALAPVTPAVAIGGANVTLTVTTKAGAPVPGLEIYAIPVSDLVADPSKFQGWGEDLGGGRYRFQFLDHNQDYTFEFRSSSVSYSQYLGGSLRLESAEVVSWPAAGEYTLTTTLGTNSSIAGRVTGSRGAAVPGAAVTAYRFDGTGWLAERTARTNSAGNYVIPAIPPGLYRVGFAGPLGTNYQSEFSGDTMTFSSAFAFTVPIGLTVASNASLALAGGAVNGTAYIIDYPPGGLYTEAVGVTAVAYRLTEPVVPGAPEIDWSVPARSSAPTTYATGGRWSVGGLEAGNYVVKLWHEWEDFDPRWIGGGQRGVNELADAQVVTVTAGRTTATPRTMLPWRNSLAPITLTVTPQAPGYTPLYGSLAMASTTEPGVGYSSTGSSHFDNPAGDSVGFFGTANGYLLNAHPEFGEYVVIFYKPGYVPFVRTFSLFSTGSMTWSFVVDPRTTPFGFDQGPTVSGGPLGVGQEFSVDAHTTIETGPDPRDVLYQFQWLRDGNEIHGATNPTYTAQEGDVGAELSVLVTANEELLVAFFDGGPTISEIVTVGVIEPGPAPTNVTSPWISSPAPPKPGVTLTANSGVWDTTGLKFDYRWFSDGAPIAGATSRTLALTALEATHDITVELIATKPGHPASDPIVSDPVEVENLAAPIQSKASLVTKSTTGLPAGQVRYTVSPGVWNVPGLTFSYLWSVDGVGASVLGNSLVVDTATQGGSVIQVNVSAERQGYTNANRIVLVQKGAAPAGTLTVTDETASRAVDDLSQTELGHVLRATPSITYPYALGGTVITTYSWQRSTTGSSRWTAIAGANQATYTPTAADLNKFLRVVTTTGSSLYGLVVQTGLAGTVIARSDLATGTPPAVAISGSSSVGTTQRATITGAWPVAGVTLSYRWLTCSIDCDTPGNFTVVSRATAPAWVPPAALAGHEAVVEVTASKLGYTPLTVRSASIVLDPLTAVTAFTPPTVTGGTIAGDGAVGRPLSVTPGTFDVTVTRSYQWQYCDSSVEDCVEVTDFTNVGTNSASYTPTAVGVTRVQETAARAGLTPAVQVSAPIDVQLGTLVAKVAPFVTRAGNAYSINAGSTLPSATATYQWYLDGTPAFAGETTVTDADPSTSLHVVVTLTREGYAPRTVTVVARKGAAPTATGTITGSSFGETFVAPNDFVYPATATPAPLTTYQWLVNGVAIARATAGTYAVPLAYVGKTISVRVTSTSPFYTPKVYTTPGVVVQKAAAPTGSPVVVSSTSEVTPGARLSVSLGAWSTPGATFSYLWQSSPDGVAWTNLSTASTYTLLTTQPGLQIRVLVTARKAGFVDAVVPVGAGTVDWLGPIVNASEPTLGGPLLSGAASPVGSALTAAPGLWNVSGLTYAYQWIRDGIVVPGATGATFTPTAEFSGDQLQVRVTATAAGYLPVSALSNIVIVGQGAAPLATTAPRITRSGNVLAATPGIWNVDGLVFSFQWMLDGNPIVGATAPTYAITGAGTYGIVVTTSRDGYATGSTTTTMTTPISQL